MKTKTFLLTHPEENLTIALVTSDVMEEGTYFHVLEGEVEEAEIVELLKRDFPAHPTALNFMFDEVAI